MNILVVSHSYLSKENRKNLRELGKKAKVKVVSPSSMKGHLHEYNVQVEEIEGDNWTMNFKGRKKNIWKRCTIYS